MSFNWRRHNQAISGELGEEAGGHSGAHTGALVVDDHVHHPGFERLKFEEPVKSTTSEYCLSR
jgi:hypothetical protein